MQDVSALTVTEVLTEAKELVRQWATYTVEGEVGGFRGPHASSGHCYFDLKDDQSTLPSIVWRGVYQHHGLELRDGMSIRATGTFDIRPQTGRMSFIIKSMEETGEGLLLRRMRELAQQLEREGLLDPARKRPIPAFCQRICVITSLSGSVLDDVCRTLARRNPLVAIEVVGSRVQGEDAPPSIVAALKYAETTRPDAILVVRGGGSLTDLNCYNAESVARAIAECSVPVVTGIGHEPDTTIADMVSDRRASTPTAAAESVAPAFDEILRTVTARSERLVRCARTDLATREERLDACERLANQALQTRFASLASQVEMFSKQRVLADPFARYEDLRMDLTLFGERLHEVLPRTLARNQEAAHALSERLTAVLPRLTQPARSSLQVLEQRFAGVQSRMLTDRAAVVARLAGSLEALSPVRVLARGYAIARDEKGTILRSASAVQPGDTISVALDTGTLSAEVTQVHS